MAEQPDLFARPLCATGVTEAPAMARFVDAGTLGDLQHRHAERGLAGLDEGHMLALVLHYCLAPGVDPEGASDALLMRFGGVARVLGAPEADLARVIGPPAARQLTFLHVLLLRVLEHPLRQRTLLTSHEAVRAYLRASLAALPREAFHVLFLDTKNQLLADERMGSGTIDHAPVYPREVVRRALELSAGALVLVHNHPSGDATPSRADIDMTKQVVEAARALQIGVHDHFIVAGDQVASFKALGLM